MSSEEPTQLLPEQLGDRYPYDLFFAGDDHPRHGCKIIGETGKERRKIFYSFNTQCPPTESDATTTVSNPQRTVATMTWTMRTHFGTYRVENMRRPDMMSHLYMVSGSSGRLFQTSSGQRYEWRKDLVTNLPGAYDLRSAATGEVLGGFRRLPQPRKTINGLVVYATLTHNFDDDELLVYALMALCVNRWVDLHGL